MEGQGVVIWFGGEDYEYRFQWYDVGGHPLDLQKVRGDFKSMVNDTIDELMDLDMEHNTESLWWTSTYKDEDGVTLKVGGAGATAGRCRSLRSSICWDADFQGLGRAFRGPRGR